jgi:UPF0271 protein
MDSVNTTATIDLNVDFGESDRESPSPNELAILGLASSINLSCGVHAGNVPLLRSILRTAASLPVALGAHPSYDDRLNFGRRETGLSASAIEPLVTAQVLALMTLAREAGVRIRYIKAHGALYHRTAHDAEAAAALCRAALGIDSRPIPLLGPGEGSELEKVARRAGVPFFREGFLDRGYRANGKLVARGEEGALIIDPVETSARAVAIARRQPIAAVDGTPVTITADSLCVHGDTVAALAHVQSAREALRSAGVDVSPFAS